ncbi:MAG: bifunctional methylenetetrahydrofolate dehydrogenase/methenyltetrahydrofolate cyclohydrolase FolD [Betaproteobacteria bacterium]|nr:bifunctional methylenetetrahydrofolate dehydrogenase/methenyltetrahydrofolate cyclohydrolase FolD [Betaproteobacteria bacterium]
MTAKLIDGNQLSQELRAEFRVRVDRLRSIGVTPGLAVVIVGDDPASKVYVRNKARACEAIGMHSEVHALAASTTEAELIAFISRLNTNPAIHGILVQLPLPRQIDSRAVIEAIAAAKDVDGFAYGNIGELVVGESLFPPCTPFGAMKMLEFAGVAVEGKHAVVIGRSNIVGKPMALLLLHAGATVTVCHSRTRDLAGIVRQGDIVVAAVGKPRMVTADMVKPGAVVIDVGINRLPDGKLVGDVDFDTVKEIASWITPVPGGVGPMTITMLLSNTLKAAETAAGIRATRADTRIG